MFLKNVDFKSCGKIQVDFAASHHSFTLQPTVTLPFRLASPLIVLPFCFRPHPSIQIMTATDQCGVNFIG